jgi:hypothetical protein
MEATPTPNGLVLSQQQYILNLLCKNVLEAKLVKSLMSCAHALSLFYGDPLTHPSPYCSLVGTLHYLSLIRPNISFVVKKSLNSSTSLPPSICKPWSASYTISSSLFLMASYFAGLPPGHFKPTLTPIGLVAPIIENPLEAYAYSLGPISFLSPLTNNA